MDDSRRRRRNARVIELSTFSVIYTLLFCLYETVTHIHRVCECVNLCVCECVYVFFFSAWMIQEEEEEEVCVLINHQISSLCI